MNADAHQRRLSYAVAIAATAAAMLLRWMLDPWMGDSYPFVTLFGAVAAAVWYGGYRPALVAASAGVIACEYLFIAPRESFALSSAGDWIGLILFLFTCAVIIGFGEAMRLARRRTQEGRELLQVTFASIGDAVITTDTQGRITYLNAVAEEVTGWTAIDAVGQPLDAVFQIVNERTREKVKNPVEKVLAEGKVVGLANHTTLIVKDGTERPIEDSAAPIRDAEDRILGAVLVFRDVTEHRGGERAIRSLAAIVESSDDAIIGENLNGTITTWNCAAERVFGYSAAEAIGQPIAILYPPDRTEEMSEILARLRNGEKVDHFDTVRRAKDGRFVPISLTVSPIRDDDGAIVGASKSCRDISERKRAEAALREEKSRLHTMLVSIGDGVIVTDGESRVTMLNPVAQTLTGWQDEAIGRPLAEIFRIISERTRQPVENPVLRALAEGTVIGLANHTTLIAKDGTEIPIDDSAAPIKDEAGRVVGCVLIFRDITERRRAEQQRADDAARIESIVNHVIAGIIAIDENGTVEAFNPAAERLFGYKAEEVIGQNVRMLMPEPFHSEHDGYIGNYLRTGQAKIIGIGREVEGRCKDGSTFPMDLAVSEFSLAKRRHFTGIVRDITERKRAYQALQFSEQRARSFLDSSAIIAWLKDEEGRNVFLSENYVRRFGLEDWKDKTDFELWPRDIAEEFRRNDLVVLGRDRPFECVEEARTPSGEVSYWLNSKFWFQDAVGRKFVGGVGVDITEREQAEEAIQALNAQLAADVEGMSRLQDFSTKLVVAGDFPHLLDQLLHAAIVVSAADMGNIQLVEGGVLKIAVQRGFEAHFLDFFNSVHDGDAACGVAMQNRERVVIADVTNSPVFANTPALEVMLAANARAVQSTPLVSRSGRVLGMVSTHYRVPHRPPERALRLLDLLARLGADLIEREQAQATLRRQDALIRVVNDNTSDLIFMKDREGRLTYTNAATLRVIGMTAEQAIGSWDQEYFRRPEEHEAISANDRRVIETGHSLTAEEPYTCADGKRRVFLSSKSPLRDEQGQIMGVVGVSQDITERKEMERERDERAAELAVALGKRTEEARRAEKAEQLLREADRRKDEFLATLAHELRNPLAPLRNALELLRRADDNKPLVEQTRGIMERQVSQMVRLVDDLLDVSRITQSKLLLRKERIDLVDVLKAAVETARPIIDASAHELTVTIPSEAVCVQADATRLAQVFANLLNNAAKYTEKGGHIWLTAERRNDEAVVSVRDTGVGLAPEHLSNIFNMFSQIAPALERSQGGLGIGLSLVKGIVDLHGGAVAARSAGPGKGSEFIVRLPTVKMPVEATHEPSGGDGTSSARQCRILVVDDLRDAANSMALMLRMMGHDTRTAYDGLEALQSAATFQPHIVLLDIGLPKMNGYETARRIRDEAWGGNIALVALTGWGQDEDRRRALESEFDHHLTKPVAVAALEKLLANLVPASPE